MKKSRLFPALVISLIIAIIFLNGIMIRENGANTETICGRRRKIRMSS